MAEKFNPFNIENVRSELEYVDFKSLKEVRNPIIFDTNFLFCTFQFRIDIIDSLENLVGKTFSLYIYEGTIAELANLGKKKTPNKKFLPLIATMLKRYNFKIIKSEQKYIDDQILENLDRDVLIATNDKELIKRIKSGGGKGILVRQKSFLEFF
ncbi:MAG: PIN domain-containing protein [Nanoarchaeota archaeon]